MIRGKKIAIFGASGGGRNLYRWILGNGLGTIEYFIDNSEGKNHTLFEGVEVLWAEDFFTMENYLDYYVIVASVHHEAMRKQLAQHEFPWKQVVNKAILVKWMYEGYCGFEIPEVSFNPKMQVVFDLDMGFCLGGIEKWTYNLAKSMLERNMDCWLLAKKTGELPPGELEENAIIVEGIEDFYDFDRTSIQILIDKLSGLLPCTVLLAQIDDLYIAAHFIKEKYSDAIQLVSVIHGGLDSIFQTNYIYQDWCDKIFCVSSDTKSRLIDYYLLDEKKVFFKETPVIVEELTEHQYTLEGGKPLKLLYAARLEKLHKRSELISPLVEHLERLECNYLLDVAGDGELFSRLVEWIAEQKLESKVHMLGRIPYENMSMLWNTHDVMLNVSECEGCCVAMLEAMAYGAVPVLTDVYSVRHFVTNGENGYIVAVEDIERMAEIVYELDKNREKLPAMGNRCINVIREKCNMKDYTDYFVSKIICGFLQTNKNDIESED
jgi:glycosyltransferase involved in cell wall biosynthesis